MRPITATVNAATPMVMVRMDNFATAVLAAAIVVTGGAQFVLYHSNDDPNDLVNPIPAANMAWDQSLLPAGAQSGSANISFQVMAAPLWFRLVLFGSLGSVKATFLQVGTHSHSNISQGPFAPPHMAPEDLRPGSNYGARGT